MVLKQIIMIVISVFFVISAIDYLIGNKLGLGQEFYRAFSLIGHMALCIAGMICLSPVIAQLLKPVIVPIFGLLGVDSAMFAPIILAPDSGGYSIAMDMATNPMVGAWTGTVVASHIGSNFSFNIPVNLGIISKEHHRYFSLGALSGLIACPFGCIAGGLLYNLPIGLILISLVPILVVSLFVILGLLLIPEKFMKGFILFGKAIRLVIIFGLIFAGVEQMTGLVIIPGMNPVSDGIRIAGTIGLMMAGILSMTALVSRLLAKPLASLSRILAINETSLLFSINAFVTVMPGAVSYDNMNPRGKVVFAAVVTSAANVFGAHLSFIGSYVPELLAPMIVGKLVSGILGITIAVLFSRKLLDKKAEPVVVTQDTKE